MAEPEFPPDYFWNHVKYPFFRRSMTDIIRPPFTERYCFTAPRTAISCEVDFDAEEGEWVATSAHGFRGSSRVSAEDAALACFSAWVGGRRAWFEPEGET